LKFLTWLTIDETCLAISERCFSPLLFVNETTLVSDESKRSFGADCRIVEDLGRFSVSWFFDGFFRISLLHW
jgi:hypothetical protein